MNNFQFSLFNFPIWGIAKLFVLFAIAIYVVFALVTIKQVRLMTDTLELGYEKAVRMAAYLHLALAVFVFIFSLIIL